MSFEISASAIRVFYGFKNRALTRETFLQNVGHTFMPGTPYMLRNLGLASYTSGVLVQDNPLGPDEFAIIGYATQDTWRAALTDTLQGRMYSQTHGGFYDMTRSKASFPIPLAQLPLDASDPFFVWGEFADWQCGRIDVFVGLRKDPQTRVFREEVRKVVPTLQQGDYDCLVCLPADDFVVIWAHAASDDAGSISWDQVAEVCSNVLTQSAKRALWRGSEPPEQDLRQSQVINWIFVRKEQFFLE